MEENRYLFVDVSNLVNYLLFRNPEITPLRLQKTLYFLYAYYGATYGQMNDEQEESSVYEGGFSYPKELFPGVFEAWKFGPVINDVYVNFKNKGFYKSEDWNAPNEFFEDVKDFLDDLVGQLEGVGDFGLVERSHMDDAWKSPYEEGVQHIPMDNSKIIKEYVEKYV